MLLSLKRSLHNRVIFSCKTTRKFVQKIKKHLDVFKKTW